MKILWSSNAPWAATGYGNQTRLFPPRLKEAGHELAIQAWYGLEGGTLNWNGIPVLPKAFHAFGQDIFGVHSRQFKADIAITLIDAWVMDSQLHGPDVRWVPWFPVDMEPLPVAILNQLLGIKDGSRVAPGAFASIVYSKFGLKQARYCGLDPYYVPHGVDTKRFTPGSKSDERRRLKWPEDKFIFGMVAANKGTPSRKCFPQQIEAFARLHRRHRDTVLYLHTNQSTHGEMGGVNLPELVRALGLEIGRDVLFADPYMQVIGYPDDYMVAAYRAMDVLANVSMGEGFGIPIVEAQACGTPVIAGDWTSMSEVFFGGWLLPKECAEKTWTPLAAYQYTPQVGAIADALKAAYDSRADHGATCRAGAEKYDADLVTTNYWLPVLEQIAARLPVKEELPDAVPA